MEETLEHRVARVAAHHALTPLANGSAENFRLVSEGHSAVTRHVATHWQVAEDFMAGILTAILAEPSPHASADNAIVASRPRAEAMALHSICAALSLLPSLSSPRVSVPSGFPARLITPPRTLLVLSTTKGNIDLLTPDAPAPEAVRLGHLADTLCRELGLTLPPITISNACTSGVCALIVASRAIATGQCDTAIVCGIEAQSRFIVSGFQSFHALSPEACQPFSANRQGLNVGEAAATIILQAADPAMLSDGDWVIAAGAIRNDANHISGPSRTGEGSFRALEAVMRDAQPEDLAFISVHGTATPYNDEMESIAIERAGLIDVPLVSLKGYYGHTMGAAGVLETILSLEAVNHGIVPATLGFDGQLGVSCPVSVSAANRPTDKHSFIKLISGFGGVNAAIRLCRHDGNGKSGCTNIPGHSALSRTIGHSSITSFPISITPTSATLNGRPLPTTQTGDALLTELYRISQASYPKFYKMDGLCRLGFVASELLLDSLGEERFAVRDDRAVVLLSRNGCLATDINYASTIKPGDDYFPSPAVFVYTLPNIVTGEIAIRNKYFAETSMYLTETTNPDEQQHILERLAGLTFADSAVNSILTGWLDYTDGMTFEARLAIINRQ